MEIMHTLNDSNCLECSRCSFRGSDYESIQIHTGTIHPEFCDEMDTAGLGNLIFYQKSAKLFHCFKCFFTSKMFSNVYHHITARHALPDKSASEPKDILLGNKEQNGNSESNDKQTVDSNEDKISVGEGSEPDEKEKMPVCMKTEENVMSPLKDEIKPKEEESFDADSNIFPFEMQSMNTEEAKDKISTSDEEPVDFESSENSNIYHAMNKISSSSAILQHIPDFSDDEENPPLPKEIMEFSDNEETVPLPKEIMDYSDNEGTSAIAKESMDFSDTEEMPVAPKEMMEFSDGEETTALPKDIMEFSDNEDEPAQSRAADFSDNEDSLRKDKPEFSDVEETPSHSKDAHDFSDDEETPVLSKDIPDLSDTEETTVVSKNTPEFSDDEEAPLSKDIPEFSDDEEAPLSKAMAEYSGDEEASLSKGMAEYSGDEEAPLTKGMAEYSGDEEAPLSKGMAEYFGDEDTPLSKGMAEYSGDEENVAESKEMLEYSDDDYTTPLPDMHEFSDNEDTSRSKDLPEFSDNEDTSTRSKDLMDFSDSEELPTSKDIEFSDNEENSQPKETMIFSDIKESSLEAKGILPYSDSEDTPARPKGIMEFSDDEEITAFSKDIPKLTEDSISPSTPTRPDDAPDFIDNINGLESIKDMLASTLGEMTPVKANENFLDKTTVSLELQTPVHSKDLIEFSEEDTPIKSNDPLKSPEDMTPVESKDASESEDKEALSQEDALLKYLRRAKGKYYCLMCEGRPMRKGAVLHHLVGKHNIPSPYQCKECGKNFVLENIYKNHLSSHTEGFYKCPRCSFETNHPRGFKKHQTHCQSRHSEGENLKPFDLAQSVLENEEEIAKDNTEENMEDLLSTDP